jgi:hypothetical protein
MSVYVKRALQGRMRYFADSVGEGEMYSPGATNGSSRVVRNMELNSVAENTSADGSSQTDSEVLMTQDVQRNEEVLSFSEEPAREGC